MKFIFITVLIFGIHLRVQSQIQNADSLIRQAFISITNNDAKSFLGLFPSYQQAQKLAKGIIQNVKDTNIKSQLEEQLKALNDSTFKNYEADILKNFHEIFKEGTDKGMDWKKISLVSSSYKADTLPIFEMISLRGVMNLNSNGKAYQLYFSDIAWSFVDQAWYGITLKKLIRAGEKINPEDTAFYDIKVKDVRISQEKEDAPPPPPSPPKKKTTAKSPQRKYND